MTKDLLYPLGLFRRVAAGDAADDELAFLDAWVEHDGLIDPPEDTLQRLRRIAADARPHPLRRLVGILQRGSGRPTPAFGVRGVARPYILTYIVRDICIDLELTGGSLGAQSLAGQVTGPGDWQWARLEGGQGEQAQSHIDEAGVFAFLPMAHPELLIVQGSTEEVYMRLPADADGAR